MPAAVSTRRWLDAQQAESEFWAHVRGDPISVSRALVSAVELAGWASSVLPQLSPGDPWLEVGIGPLGVGCAHFLSEDGAREIVGVDPLPLVPTSELSLPGPLMAAVSACRERSYRHVTTPGESTGLNPERFELAILNNVLDHVQDPEAVMAEAHRLLRPGGFLVLACDVFSLLGRGKHALYLRRRMPDSILVRAHPFRFAASQVKRLVVEAGFRPLAAEGENSSRRARLGAGAHRMFLAAQRIPE